jgi:MoaA/NifB/PqqE/SkfB family radical SAM enzyme
MEIKKDGGIIISPGCELNCLFCSGHRIRPNIQELKKQEVAVFKNLQDFKLAGIKKIVISGSDPIEYGHIGELMEYIKNQGFEKINLSTHGASLFDPNFSKKIIKSGIDEIRLPIYGSNPKIHEAMTRTPGSFKKLISAIKNLKKQGPNISIQISCLIFNNNKNDLLKIIDFVDDLGIKNFYFSIPCIEENDYSFYVPLKDLAEYLIPAYRYGLKINKEIKFLEIPFCVFKDFNLNNINNTIGPPNLGRYNQPPKSVRTSIPDLPSYRLKKKTIMCQKCKANKYCDGFFVNDIDKFGTGNLKPIKQ